MQISILKNAKIKEKTICSKSEELIIGNILNKKIITKNDAFWIFEAPLARLTVHLDRITLF